MFKIFLGFLVFSFSLVAQAEDESTFYGGENYVDGSVAPFGIDQQIADGNARPEDGDPNSPGSVNAGLDDNSDGAPAESPSGVDTDEERKEKQKKAIENYVIPTNTRNFSLGNLNSQNEASLIISSGNEENNVIFRIIRLISMLVGTVAILLYIVAGYFMIFSQGDDNSLTKGKQIITFTSLGLVIVFGAYMIVQLVMGLIYFTS